MVDTTTMGVLCLKLKRAMVKCRWIGDPWVLGGCQRCIGKSVMQRWNFFSRCRLDVSVLPVEYLLIYVAIFLPFLSQGSASFLRRGQIGRGGY